MAQHYRVLLYEGDSEWIEKCLDQSIHGTKDISRVNKITAADVSPEDARAILFFRNAIHRAQATVAESDNDKGFD